LLPSTGIVATRLYFGVVTTVSVELINILPVLDSLEAPCHRDNDPEMVEAHLGGQRQERIE